MRTIPLTHGKIALVSDEDYERVNQFKWRASWQGRHWYAASGDNTKLHRFILGLENPKIIVDHIDGDELNCQRSNMRVCTNAENLRNRGKQKNNTSGFKGVIWYAPSRKWRAQIKLNGNRKHLGHFDNIIDAARAYDEAAVKYFGEFAQLNGV